VTVEVHGTGVAIRLATAHEAREVADARHGLGAFIDEPRSHMIDGEPLAPGEEGVLVVAQAFAEFTAEGRAQRWTSMEHHGHEVPVERDATMELLRIARATDEDVIDLLGDMGIAGLPVTRWALLSAPRRIELEPALERRLAPLRRR
jgi:hypothetical protein